MINYITILDNETSSIHIHPFETLDYCNEAENTPADLVRDLGYSYAVHPFMISEDIPSFDHNEDTYVVIEWPESQSLMDKDGFHDNSILINEEPMLGNYGSSAYMVSTKWLKHQKL